MSTTYVKSPWCYHSSVRVFISVHGFRGLSLLAAVLMCLGSGSMWWKTAVYIKVDGKQRGQWKGVMDNRLK